MKQALLFILLTFAKVSFANCGYENSEANTSLSLNYEVDTANLYPSDCELSPENQNTIDQVVKQSANPFKPGIYHSMQYYFFASNHNILYLRRDHSFVFQDKGSFLFFFATLNTKCGTWHQIGRLIVLKSQKTSPMYFIIDSTTKESLILNDVSGFTYKDVDSISGCLAFIVKYGWVIFPFAFFLGIGIIVCLFEPSLAR